MSILGTFLLPAIIEPCWFRASKTVILSGAQKEEDKL